MPHSFWTNIGNSGHSVAETASFAAHYIPSSRCERKYHLEPDSHQPQTRKDLLLPSPSLGSHFQCTDLRGSLIFPSTTL